MYEFWYDYIKPKYGKRAKLYYMDTDSFITHIKTEDICKDTSEDVEKIFDTYPMGEKKKAVGLIEDELGGKIKKNFFELRAKKFSYLKVCCKEKT